MTITNPVGQQPTPTHHHHGTRGGKREWNLHTEGCSSPSKPSAGGRASGRRSRRVGNRRTGRHTGNYRTITRNLCTTPPPKCLTFYHSLPLPQPRANTTPTFHFPIPPPPHSPPRFRRSQYRKQKSRTPQCPQKFATRHSTKPSSPKPASCATLA